MPQAKRGLTGHTEKAVEAADRVVAKAQRIKGAPLPPEDKAEQTRTNALRVSAASRAACS